MPHLPSVRSKPGATWVIDAVFCTSDGKTIQVCITPAKGNMDCIMEISQRTVFPHEQATPNHGANLT